ncbi:MAG: hypothetical protein EBR82_14675 [Caulobacteraceae bacterium]|nr:hypothetical protein [Caulobacteraceae bacterium]
MNPIVSSTAATASSLPSISGRDEQKIRAAKAAVDSMNVRQDKASDERKAIAKKKAEELKARIQMLKMSMPANPEAVGKIIAQLARELGAIVKSYGGSGSDAGVTSTATATATPGAGGEATASGSEAAPTVAPSDGAEPSTDANADANPDAASGAAPKDPYRAAMAAQSAANADQARKAESAREDSEFATLVKQLLAELKAMKAKAEVDAKAAGDATTPGVADADKALDAVDAALGDAGLSGSMVSLVV